MAYGCMGHKYFGYGHMCNISCFLMTDLCFCLVLQMDNTYQELIRPENEQRPQPQPIPAQPMPSHPMPPQPMPPQPMPPQPMPAQPMPAQPMPAQPMPGQPMQPGVIMQVLKGRMHD